MFRTARRVFAVALVVGGGAVALLPGTAGATTGAGTAGCVSGQPQTTFTINGDSIDPSKTSAHYTYDYGAPIPGTDQTRDAAGNIPNVSFVEPGVVKAITIHAFFDGPDAHSDQLLTLYLIGGVPDCSAPPTTTTAPPTTLATTTTVRHTTTTHGHHTTTTVRKHTTTTGVLPHTGSDGQKRAAGVAVAFIGLGWLSVDATRRRRVKV